MTVLVTPRQKPATETWPVDGAVRRHRGTAVVRRLSVSPLCPTGLPSACLARCGSVATVAAGCSHPRRHPCRRRCLDSDVVRLLMPPPRSAGAPEAPCEPSSSSPAEIFDRARARSVAVAAAAGSPAGTSDEQSDCTSPIRDEREPGAVVLRSGDSVGAAHHTTAPVAVRAAVPRSRRPRRCT